MNEKPKFSPPPSPLAIAAEMAKTIDGLNPQCLSLGAGMMAHLKELAEKFIAANK